MKIPLVTGLTLKRLNKVQKFKVNKCITNFVTYPMNTRSNQCQEMCSQSKTICENNETSPPGIDNPY